MNKQITIAILLISSLSAFAQVTQEDFDKGIKPLNEKIISLEKDFQKEIKTLQSEKSKLKTEVENLNLKLSAANKSIDSLRSQMGANSNAISQTANELGIKIKETGDKNEGKITEVSESLSKNSLYGIIGVLSAVLLTALLFWLLSKRQKSDKSDVESKIETTKNSLLNDSARLDTKLTDILEKQLSLIQTERNISNKSNDISEVDHSLPLKVADEITRINAYANTLDPNSQDSRALKSSVRRLTNTFRAANYDIVDLLGQRYDDGLRVIVINQIPDEKLKKGEEIISRIIKPLVKYNGEQIQAAQVDISIAL